MARAEAPTTMVGVLGAEVGCCPEMDDGRTLTAKSGDETHTHTHAQTQQRHTKRSEAMRRQRCEVRRADRS